MRGIVATLYKGRRNHLYPGGPRTFFFATMVQGAVEQAMAVMGFGGGDYYLKFGALKKDKE